MNKLLKILAVASLLLFNALSVRPQSKPPAYYVDKGACPFECCTYRKWKTERTTIAYARPNLKSKRVGKFRAGTTVAGLTGEVRVVPGRLVVTKAHDRYQPGDVLWVYTPLGEGFYKVWFKGKMYQEEMPYMSGPYEQSYPRCEDTPECWGKLEKEMKTEWWVKIRSAQGWIGWTNLAENFSNIDACG
jgi:hypothetical protein